MAIQYRAKKKKTSKNKDLCKNEGSPQSARFVRENEHRDILQYRIFKQYLCWKPLNSFKHHCPFLLGSWHIQTDLTVEHMYSMVLSHIAMLCPQSNKKPE